MKILPCRIVYFLLVCFLPALGYSSGGTIYNPSNGYYWSSTQYPSDSNNGYNLNFNSGGSNPNNANTKTNAFSVRCVQP